MRTNLLAVVLATAVFHAGAGHAQNSSSDFLEFCRETLEPNSGFDGGMCMGFAIGSASTAIRMEAEVGQHASYCVPGDVTFGEIIPVWIHYLENHPESLAVAPVHTYFSALEEAFPCTVAAVPSTTSSELDSTQIR
jgi:hypothetical protein